MTVSFPLYLEGVGFLERIARKDGKIWVRIRVSSSSEKSNTRLPDEMLLNCEVPFSLLADIQKFESQYKASGEFRVYFLAKFLRFADYFAGMTPEDPKHMLMLNCQLQWMEENVDGNLSLHLNPSSIDEPVVVLQ